MIGGVTRLGRVTLPAGVAFRHVNVSMWGNPATRLPKCPPYWNRNNMSQSRGYQRGELFRQVHLPSVERRNHAIFSRKLTPGPWGDNIACKRELFFGHGWAGYLIYPGSPHLHVNRPLLLHLLPNQMLHVVDVTPCNFNSHKARDFSVF